MSKTEIEFRGIRVDNSEFIHGYLYQSNKESWITDSINIHLSTHRNIAWFQVIPETVGQYIGLMIGSTRLFKGDILENPQGRRGYIDFEDGMFCLKTNRDKNTIWSMNLSNGFLKNKTLIGNIHQHPELLLL